MQQDQQIAILKYTTTSGKQFVAPAQSVERVNLLARHNVMRVEDGLMTAAEFNALPATQAASDFFAGKQHIERALESTLEVE